MVRNADEKEVAELDEILGAPPESEAAQGAETPGWSREDQLSAFASF